MKPPQQLPHRLPSDRVGDAVEHRQPRDLPLVIERHHFSDDPAGASVSFKVGVAGQTWTDLLTGDLIASSGNDVTVWVGRSWGRVLSRVD